MPLDYALESIIQTMVSFEASKTVHSLPQKCLCIINSNLSLRGKLVRSRNTGETRLSSSSPFFESLGTRLDNDFFLFFFAAQNGILEFQINDNPVNNGSTSYFTSSNEVIIKCVYFNSAFRLSPIMSVYDSGEFVNLFLPSHVGDKYSFLEYNVHDSDKQDLRIYRCSDTTTTTYVEIKLNFSDCK